MAKEKKSALGSGLNALFQTNAEDEPINVENSVIKININDIEPGEGQPRINFDKEKIEQLAESIKEHGIIQPIVVSKQGKVYRIIAGERRWRAARVAGLKEVPAIEKTTTRREAIELALIENVQREDLNAIEEAEAYIRLMTEFNLTQDQLSKAVGKSRSAIANKTRLLALAKSIRNMIVDGRLSEAHGRTIVSIDKKELQEKVAALVIENSLNVRQTEELVKKVLSGKYSFDEKQKKTKSEKNQIADADTLKIQNELKNALGTKVKLVDKAGKGQIVIDYFSADERERIIDYIINRS